MSPTFYEEGSYVGRDAVDADSRVADKAPYEAFARAGYAAKGAVYSLIGVLVLLAAFGPRSGSGQTTGSEGALRVLGDGTFGTVVLALLAIGLVGYVLWRLVQAFVDPENVSDDDWGWAKRLLYFVSAAVYAVLAWQAITMLLGGSTQSASGGSETRTMTAQLLDQPFGPWLVGLIAVAIAIRGLMQAREAYDESFFERIRHTGELSHDTVRRIGKVGLTARGIVFLMIAVFLGWAAVDENARHARGLEGALDTLANATGGPWLLGAAGAGLLAYGLFQFIKSRYRVIG